MEGGDSDEDVAASVSDFSSSGVRPTGSSKGIGITTIGELAQSDPDILTGKTGREVIWGFANESICSGGGSPPNKGYSNSTTVAFDVCDTETAKLVLLSLAETLGARLRKDGVKNRCGGGGNPGLSVRIPFSSDFAGNADQHHEGTVWGGMPGI